MSKSSLLFQHPEFQNVILPDGINLGSKTNSLPFEEEIGATRPLPEIREEVEIPKNADPLVELILQQRNELAKKQKAKQNPPKAQSSKPRSPKKGKGGDK